MCHTLPTRIIGCFWGWTLDKAARILVVDDEPDIRETLCAHLGRNGFEAVSAENADNARTLLKSQETDLVVLDIMMPGEDGLSLCRHLRETSNTPVILLTALADDTDRIVGLEIGADDYVTKPFNPRELIARIKAVLRRAGTGNAAANDDSKATIVDGLLKFDRWQLDTAQSELRRDDGLIVPVSTGELSLLRVFLTHPGDVLSRDDLMELTRGREALPFERSIDNMISRVRRKIEADPKTPRIIKTVWGGGYRLTADVTS